MTPEERAERRAVARRHHPDLGGDPAAFDEAMRRLDARTTSRPGPVTVHRTTRGRADRLLAAPAALVTRLRRHLPRSFPGARRYGRL